MGSPATGPISRADGHAQVAGLDGTLASSADGRPTSHRMTRLGATIAQGSGSNSAWRKAVSAMYAVGSWRSAHLGFGPNVG